MGLMKNYDENIKKMILYISIIDFINFYKKSKGTCYEFKIKKELYDFVNGIDIYMMNYIILIGLMNILRL